MPHKREIKTIGDLFDVIGYVRDSSELFKLPSDKKLQKDYKDKRDQLGIAIAREEGMSVGAFQVLERTARLKPKSKALATEFLSWLKEKKLHP